LPYASTLCGACYEVCPVKINIPEVLLHLRGEVTRHASPFYPEALVMRELAHIFASPERYERAQRLAHHGQRFFMHGGVIDHLPGTFSGWTTARDLAPVPKQSFRDWWRARKKESQ
jgi:L-lactate dehydrogenase complex protein LldF